MEGESSNCDRYCKRLKVCSSIRDYIYTAATASDADLSGPSTDGDFNGSLRSSFSFRNGMFYQFPQLHGSNAVPFNSSGEGNDERDGFGATKQENFEVSMDLTDDLLHLVFSFLDQIELCRAAIVCRQWQTASTHQDFWRFLNFENRNISEQQFEDVCRRYSNATRVNISGTPVIHQLAVEAVSSLRNLESLILGKGQVGDYFFQALAGCNMLKRLVVDDAMLSNGFSEILIIHDRLLHLEITKCRVFRVSIRCPQLEVLSLKRSSMTSAALNCPFLHELDIGSCHKLSDAGIRLIATSCPLLESLDLSNCSCTSDETLREISLSCANVHILDASYCPSISFVAVRLPMLTVLKLHSCDGITSSSMASVSHCHMLEVLELDNCCLLTSVSLELPHLQNISLVHCHRFADLNLQSNMLSAIAVSNCASLSHISITSYSLEKLVLQKQESLTTLALQCHQLQKVDLTDCESLKNSICEVFSDGGGCPVLKTLILDNCESLTALKLCNTSLLSLSLAGCRFITALELTCPHLEHISLDGCEHIERASFYLVGLQSLNLGICPKVNALNIEAPNMVLLELKGCGVLIEASINCPLLTSLDASFCSQLKDNCLSATSVSCPLIESLILMRCPAIGSDGLYSLCCLQHLTLLDLSYTFLTNLQPVFESCSKLKVLKLQACKLLTHSSLEALYKESALPFLQELDLSYGALCQSAIEGLLMFCTRLTRVSLDGCENMHDLNWGYGGDQPSEFSGASIAVSSHENMYDPLELPNYLLQKLNCVGCVNITKVHIPPMAHCFHLSSLNLSLSGNLKEVNIACLNLCFLNLSNCCSLQILELKCPRLTSLFLQSCNIDEGAIEAAISQCRMMETLDIRLCPKICLASIGKLRRVCPSLKRIFNSLPPS